MRLLLTFAFALVLLTWLPAAPLLADDDPQPPSDEAAEGPAADAPAAAEDAASRPEEEKARPLHKIYVPYHDLAKIFEKEGQGVFLPYEEFLKLWRRAHRVEPAREGAPVAAALREASYVGRVERDVVVLDAALEVEVLEDGWQSVRLDFGGAGIESATIGDRPALVVPGEKGRPILVLDGKGRRTLSLRLRVPAVRKGDRREVAFTMPPVPLSRLSLEVPGGATEVTIDPQVAFTTTPADGKTRIEAFLGPVGAIHLGWRPKAEQEPDLQPLVFAEVRHDVRLAPGVLRTETAVDLSVLRAPLTRLSLAVPSDAITLFVRGDGLRTWRRSADGTRLDLELREPVKEHWQVVLGLERPLPPLPAVVSLPLAGVENVERENGFLRLLAGEGVKAEAVETPGLRQVDTSELPKELQGVGGREAAWRFATRPGDVKVRIEALEPRVDVALGQRVTVRTEGTSLNALAALDVTRAGIFGIRIALPEGLEVSEVTVAGAAVYDDHKTSEEDGRRVLEVSFRDRLLGSATVTVTGRIPTPLGEEGDNAWTDLDAPLLEVLDADHVRGYVELRVDPSLEHREQGREGLVELDASAPVAQAPPAPRMQPSPLARRYEHHAFPIRLELGVRRRAPLITAGVETGLRLEPDRMRVNVTLRYDVRYRGVDTFRFTAPLSVADLLTLDMEGVQLLGPEPIQQEGREPDRGTWTIKLPADRMGAVPIPLEVEDVPDRPLESGAPPRRVKVPTFVPVEADGTPVPNVVQHVAIQRDPLLEVAVDTLERCEEIDPRELPASIHGDEDFLALRAYDPTWGAALLATRHDYEPIAEVVVSHMHLDTIVQGDRGTTEAYLLVRNNDRQNLALALPPGASIRALTVDGQTRTPRRAEGRVLVPLPSGLGKSEAFVVALSYDHDIRTSSLLHEETWHMDSPVPENVTADLLTWRVYLPEDREVTSTGGTLDPARPYRSWFAGLVHDLFRTFGRRAQAAQVDVEKAASGFHSPFARNYEGRVMLFYNRVGTGSVEITAAKPASSTVYRLLFFAIALGGLLLLMALARRVHLGEATVAVAAVLVVLVLLVRAGPGAAGLLNALLFGFLVAGLIRFGAASLAASRERRRARETADAQRREREAAAVAEDAAEAEGAADGGKEA